MKNTSPYINFTYLLIPCTQYRYPILHTLTIKILIFSATPDIPKHFGIWVKNHSLNFLTIYPWYCEVLFSGPFFFFGIRPFFRLLQTFYGYIYNLLFPGINLALQIFPPSAILVLYWLTRNTPTKFFSFIGIGFLIFRSFSFLNQSSIKFPLIILKHSVLPKCLYSPLVSPKVLCKYNHSASILQSYNDIKSFLHGQPPTPRKRLNKWWVFKD